MTRVLTVLGCVMAVLVLYAEATWGAPAQYRVEEALLGKWHDKTESPVISEDGLHVAYITTQGARKLAVVDGVAGPECDGIRGFCPVLTADGKHVAYAARKGNKWRVVMDGVEGPEYGDISAGSLALTADGQRVAYAAK